MSPLRCLHTKLDVRSEISHWVNTLPCKRLIVESFGGKNANFDHWSKLNMVRSKLVPVVGLPSCDEWL